jgi:hypothetical protein
MLTCLSRILVFCWGKHLWRSEQLFFVHFLMSVSGFRWWDHKPLLRIPELVVGSWGSWFILLVSFWSTADWSDQNCSFTIREVDQGGKTFDILCLFCRSYELICAWKGWLYVSLWKLLFVFLYLWHFGGLWTIFLKIIMSRFNVMNFHSLFYKTHTSNTTRRACARPPDEKNTFLNDKRLILHSHLKLQK